ncbi:glycosyl hydrolase [Chryseolinea sp. T2]|uniref:glycosyl hydrolase n=1 Tax=Chryseolinea sp. T2 TaxID=3129255 RepID=UPI00307802F9
MVIDKTLSPSDLSSAIDRFWKLSATKILSIEKNGDSATPVYTVNGRYTTRGWTEWTQGFQFGSALLQFDATSDEQFLQIGKDNTRNKMAPHLTHEGVHDHGFNNLSTYGNLWRMMHEGKIPFVSWENDFYELALKASGAVQAMRWTPIPGGGYLYSFNGPQSLFVDTIRSCRILMVSHGLGHYLHSENDVRVNLLERAVQHLRATARFSVYYGEGRDSYDAWGRTAHECIFNINDGNFRCPNAQQGFSGFTTWTRGLAWAMCGFAEELEFLGSTNYLTELASDGDELILALLKAATATCDFYIKHSSSDGIPYWDTGAPQLHRLGDYTQRPAEPHNDFEPVDSSAAAIAAQGLLRLGRFLQIADPAKGQHYVQAGLTVARTLLSDAYLSLTQNHQGLLLHSVYHRPNGWDNIPSGRTVPCDESSMWGDYHARELILYLQRLIKKEPYLSFYTPLGKHPAK